MDIETCSLCTIEYPWEVLIETDNGNICPGCDEYEQEG